MSKNSFSYRVQVNRSNGNYLENRRVGESQQEVPAKDDCTREVRRKLLQYIRTNDIENFKTTINKLFISSRIEKIDKSGTNISYMAQPTIEALFFEDPYALSDIIAALIEANKKEFFKTFKESLKNTEITEQILFTWTPLMAEQLHRAIKKMKEYGEILTEQKIIKGQTLTCLHSAISYDLATKATNDAMRNNRVPEAKPAQSDADTDNLLQQFHNLQFKLNIALTVHTESRDLSVHRGWSKWLLSGIGNILFGAVSVCTLGAGFFVCKKATGHYLPFSTNTTSCDMITEIDDALNLNSNVMKRFEVEKTHKLAESAALFCGVMYMFR